MWIRWSIDSSCSTLPRNPYDRYGEHLEISSHGSAFSLLMFTRVAGMEIRLKVEEYVYERIKALRAQHPGQYQNVSIMRMNAMKFLPNFFEKGQVINEQIKSQAKLHVICMHSLNISHPFP